LICRNGESAHRGANKFTGKGDHGENEKTVQDKKGDDVRRERGQLRQAAIEIEQKSDLKKNNDID
jgi:hypothetical protein